MSGGYRSIAAAKWASIGVFPVENRLLQSERVVRVFGPLCLDGRQFGAYREFRESHLTHGRAILNV